LLAKFELYTAAPAANLNQDQALYIKTALTTIHVANVSV